jgi:hypothetical protein
MTGQSVGPALAANLLRQAVEAAAGLPPAEVEQVKVLIDAGELKIALETLCTRAYEYDVELSPTKRQELQGLGELLDVSVGYLLGDPWADSPSANASR